jgi:hypothetical protein
MNKKAINFTLKQLIIIIITVLVAVFLIIAVNKLSKILSI